jgi:hypothetical protein
MKRLGKRGLLFMAGCLLGAVLGQVFPSFSQDSGSRFPVPEGIYVDLTRDFYKALREEGSGNTRTYTDDMSLSHLRDISISTRFMVETNLQVLKNQERIIRLLESGRK